MSRTGFRIADSMSRTCRVKLPTISGNAWKCPETNANKLQHAATQNRPLARRQKVSFCFDFQDGGGGRTRTYEGVSQRIYSPPHLPLWTLPRKLRELWTPGLYGWTARPSQSNIASALSRRWPKR